MKALLKSFLCSLAGNDRAKSIISHFRPRRPEFSEAEMIAAYFAAYPRCGVMIDVGAHFGESLAPYLAQGWCIHAFEPDSANLSELRRRMPANTRLRVHEIAVSDHNAHNVPFYASEESHGISSLSAFHKTHRQVQTVDLVMLSDILSSAAVSNVDYLKVDAEGHDLLVLRGFPWERMSPDVVLCEFEDNKTRALSYDHDDMGQFLLSQGYQVYLSEWEPIVRYGTTHRWRCIRKYPCRMRNPEAWGNFVSIRTDLDLRPFDTYISTFHSTPDASE